MFEIMVLLQAGTSHVDVCELCCCQRPHWCLWSCSILGPHWCPCPWLQLNIRYIRWPFSMLSPEVMLRTTGWVAARDHISILGHCSQKSIVISMACGAEKGFMVSVALLWHRALLMSIFSSSIKDHALALAHADTSGHDNVCGSCCHMTPCGSLWSMFLLAVKGKEVYSAEEWMTVGSWLRKRDTEGCCDNPYTYSLSEKSNRINRNLLKGLLKVI